MSTRLKWIPSLLPCDAIHEFAVQGGGCLRVGPRSVRCRVGFGAISDEERPSESSQYEVEWPEENGWIRARLEIADSRGVILEYERLVAAHLFLLAGTHATYGETARSEAAGALQVTSMVDRRDEIVMLASMQEEGLRAFGYRLRNSHATLDIVTVNDGTNSARVAVHLKETENRGLDQGPTPATTYTTPLAAVIVIWPHLVMGGQGLRGPGPVFSLTDRTTQPEPLVEYQR